MQRQLILQWLSLAKMFRLTALTCATYAKIVAVTNPHLAMTLDYEYEYACNECRDCYNKIKMIREK